MIKRVQQVTGTQVGITFTKQEREIWGIEVGIEIDLTDMIVEGKKKTRYLDNLIKDAIKQHEETKHE